MSSWSGSKVKQIRTCGSVSRFRRFRGELYGLAENSLYFWWFFELACHADTFFSSFWRADAHDWSFRTEQCISACPVSNGLAYG